MKVIAILIAKFLDPIGFVVAGLTVLASRKVVIIPIAAGASALVTETILSNTQLTYSWGNGLLLGFTVGLFQASIVFMVRKLLAPNTKDTDLSEADLVASQAIAAAKTLGAKNAKEAAEMTAGRQITDEKWEKIKEGWEKNW